MHDTDMTQQITAVVRRRIKACAEAKFEVLMQEFMAFALKQPGHLSINVIRPSQGSRDYTVMDHFASEEDRRRFTSSVEYHDWMRRLLDVSETDPEIQEMGGGGLLVHTSKQAAPASSFEHQDVRSDVAGRVSAEHALSGSCESVAARLALVAARLDHRGADRRKSDLGSDARPHEIIREMAVRLKLRRRNGLPPAIVQRFVKRSIFQFLRRYTWQTQSPS